MYNHFLGCLVLRCPLPLFFLGFKSAVESLEFIGRPVQLLQGELMAMRSNKTSKNLKQAATTTTTTATTTCLRRSTIGRIDEDPSPGAAL